MKSCFVNVKSYEDLKEQYRKLALLHHPDVGGDTETMQEINRAYDQLFIVWKHRSKVTNTETAESTRRKFYTAHGWAGERYNRNLSLKEIACLVREFVKAHYNDCKFSITTEYASMCRELHIALMETPHRAYKTFDELTEDERDKIRRAYMQHKDVTGRAISDIDAEIAKVYEKEPTVLTEEVREIKNAVEDYAESFNYDDSDAQIDYFDTNFYFFGVKIGKWDKPYKVVQRTKKAPANVEYENVEIKKTRTYTALEPQDIEPPETIEKGQFFQLKTSFNNGCYRGYVYQIEDVRETWINAYRMGKGYKNARKGRTPGNTFCPRLERLKEWVEKGAITFVELVEVTKTEEYTSVVRRPKKQEAAGAVAVA